MKPNTPKNNSKQKRKTHTQKKPETPQSPKRIIIMLKVKDIVTVLGDENFLLHFDITDCNMKKYD